MIATVSAYGGAAFVGLAFISLLKAFRLLEKAPRVMAISAHVLRDLRDPQLDDAAKEVRMRDHTKALGVLFARLAGGLLVALAAPIGVVWLLDAAGVVSLNGVLDALSSWPMLIGGTVGVMGQLWLDRAGAHGS
jgi:hypothetical protein